MIATYSGPEVQWGISKRMLFRFAFCYFLLYSFCGCNGSPSGILPVIGNDLDHWVETPIDLLALWAGTHIFHLTGRESILNIPAAGDEALCWLGVAIMLVLAAVVAIIWGFLDRHRENYDVLFGWFRLAMRFELGIALLRYGFIKVFPLQFPTPPLALLNEPVGNASPTLLFWSVYGLHPPFVMTLGWIEVVTGLLLLFRKTALCGALMALAVTTNIALLDLSFDVPVKLYSLSLTMISVVLLAPEAPLLRDLFWRHKTVVASDTWAPPFASHRTRQLMLALEIAVAVLACWQFSFGTWNVWRLKTEAMRAPAPFTGEWQVEGDSGIRGGNGAPIVTLYFDPNTDTYMRSADGALWRSRATFDRKTQRLRILYPVYGALVFTVNQPNANSLVLTPAPPSAHHLPILSMTRVPLPDRYPLLDHHFHWVNDFEELR
jgi:hypothetical protein